MADKYYVTAGAIPAFKHVKRHVKGKDGKMRMVMMGDLLEESFFEDGEIADLMRKNFIVLYEPHTVTKADLEHTSTVRNPTTGVGEQVKTNRHVIEAHDLKPGMVIHKGTKGFKPAAVTEAKK